MAQPHEQVDIQKVLGLYRTKLAETQEANIILEARLLNRDETIESLLRELDALKNQ